MTQCRPAGRHEPRVIPGRHDDRPGYHDPDCPGCQPCTEPHCTVCGDTHVEGACAECVATTRDGITQIAHLVGEPLHDEATARGVNSEAMTLIGPVPDPEAWHHVAASALAGRVVPPDCEATDLDDVRTWLDQTAASNLHPLWVLGTWDMLWRDTLEHDQPDPDEPATVQASAEYLLRHLTEMARSPLLDFGPFAHAVRDCRAHLERVVRDGEQTERGAPCLTCKKPVERTVDKQGVVTYWCDRCKESLSENRYRNTVKAEHIKKADRLCADDLAVRIDVPASTIRNWTNDKPVVRGGVRTVLPPLFRSCGMDARKRKLYRVADALAVRDAGGDRRASGTVDSDGAA
ncbi:hypothetical protein [Nocardioides sp. ChNu-99]|uniref:hypothetical protein n=1 Tax=Nocardioides sp. ChNu-99 TaxID=2839897 RepID=UPI002406C043|nr:hypothetical protein [Nocardioides sp. ChNu-99]MDF9718096.1 hypothetical protein [Nocardioides sp. ChNu-99]